MRARELDISEIAISISPNSAVEIGDHKSAISQTHSVRVINFGHGALARAFLINEKATRGMRPGSRWRSCEWHKERKTKEMIRR